MQRIWIKNVESRNIVLNINFFFINLLVIEVKDKTVLYHNEPYIDVKIIPKIEIDKIVEFLFNKSYLKLIKNKQLKFLKKRQII